MKWFSLPERAVANKDFHEIWRIGTVRAMLIALPLVLAALLPGVLTVAIVFAPPGQINGMEQMARLLPEEAKGLADRQAVFYAIVQMMCPMFFLMIPLMTSSVAASCSFVGEREGGTMETLLLTPMTVKQIFRAKVWCCLKLSFLITGLSFAAFFLVAGTGGTLLHMPLFFNLNWLVLLLLVAPSLTLLGVVFMVLVSGKSKSYMEAFQISGYLVVPVIMIFAGQLSGAFQIGPVFLIGVAAVIALLDAALWVYASRSFTPEALLRQE